MPYCIQLPYTLRQSSIGLFGFSSPGPAVGLPKTNWHFKDQVSGIFHLLVTKGVIEGW
jgi:hypothetical protein